MGIEISKRRAKRCVTHHNGCDCREYGYKQMQDALERIKLFACWHYDPEADVENSSPDDQVAHVNGLIVKECKKALEVTQ
jgi:hypothetical protein